MCCRVPKRDDAIADHLPAKKQHSTIPTASRKISWGEDGTAPEGNTGKGSCVTHGARTAQHLRATQERDHGARTAQKLKASQARMPHQLRASQDACQSGYIAILRLCQSCTRTGVWRPTYGVAENVGQGSGARVPCCWPPELVSHHLVIQIRIETDKGVSSWFSDPFGVPGGN
jgi:hypothetical protein